MNKRECTKVKRSKKKTVLLSVFSVFFMTSTNENINVSTALAKKRKKNEQIKAIYD